MPGVSTSSRAAAAGTIVPSADGEGGQPDPALAQPDVRGQLGLGRVQPADDLLGPLGQQAAGVGQPHPPAGPLQQPRAGLGLEPGDVVADRGLGVVQCVGRAGDRAVPGHGDQHPEPGHVQHASDYRSTRCFG